MKLLSNIFYRNKKIADKIASNELVKHQIIVVNKNIKRIRFGDFIVMSTLFGLFTLIPLAIVKNLGYITLKTVNNYDYFMFMFHNVIVFYFRQFNIQD
jgi:hypothetical protein